MREGWTLIIDFCLLSVFLGLGTLIKRRVTLLRKYMIPNAILAGFIGFLMGSSVLNLLPAQFLQPVSLERMVYHMMAIGFIALALKERKREKGTEITNTGLAIVSTYLIQGILGFGITLLMAFTFLKDLFPPFGLLLPLGFGQGPGQASAIGAQWEVINGVPALVGGANIGLSIAAIGFLWACVGGVPLIHYFIRKRGFKPDAYDEADAQASMIEERDRPDDIPLSESIDRVTVQLFLIGTIYLLTFLMILGLEWVFSLLGNFGQTVSTMLWGFHFIFGTVIALVVRRVLDKLKSKGSMTRNYPNNYLLQRIAGGSFDYMITAGIAAISVSVFRMYLVPTLIITTLGMIATMLYLIFLCKRIYGSHTVESTVALYGMLTGTISTGLALLREVDPNFRSPVAKHLVLGSGAGLIFGFPLMILLGIPIHGYSIGNPSFYLYTMLALLGYFALLAFLMWRVRKREKCLK